MFMKIAKRPRMFALALRLLAAACVTGLAVSVLPVPSAAAAGIASAKAAVDAAKAQGLVGEQGDGYLGLVTGSAGTATTAAMDEINTGRAAVYRETAAKTGVTAAAAGEAAAVQLFGKVPSGQYFKPLGGGWTKKP